MFNLKQLLQRIEPVTRLMSAIVFSVRQFLQLIGPAVAPLLMIAFSIGLLFVLRHWAAMPKPTEAMQRQMNRQYDRFQHQLADSADAIVQMQQRMVQSEQMRDKLKVIYEQSQEELVRTQKALNAANQELVRTQEELFRVVKTQMPEIADQAPNRAKSTVPQETKTLQAAASSAALLMQRIAKLATLRQESSRVWDAISEGRQYFERLWKDYVETSRVIDAAKRGLAHKSAQLEKQEYVEAPPFQPPANSDLGLRVAVQSADLDVIPKLSSSMKLYWIDERINERSKELVGLHNELTVLNKLLESTGTSLLELQQSLLAVQEQFRKVNCK